MQVETTTAVVERDFREIEEYMRSAEAEAARRTREVEEAREKEREATREAETQRQEARRISEVNAELCARVAEQVGLREAAMRGEEHRRRAEEASSELRRLQGAEAESARLGQRVGELELAVGEARVKVEEAAREKTTLVRSHEVEVMKLRVEYEEQLRKANQAALSEVAVVEELRSRVSALQAERDQLKAAAAAKHRTAVAPSGAPLLKLPAAQQQQGASSAAKRAQGFFNSSTGHGGSYVRP